jgi:hypothetical protein
MPLGTDQHHLGARHHLGAPHRAAAVAVEYGDLDTTVGDPRLDLPAIGLVHAQPDARVVGQHARGERADQRLRPARHDAEIDAAHRAAALAACLGGELVGFGEQRPGARQQRFAELGRLHAAPGAMEQSPAELGFERRDLPAQHRLGDAQGRGGAAEAAAVGNTTKRAHGLEVHSIAPSRSSKASLAVMAVLHRPSGR